uniref:F-box domain-containing protein n=1 Tax=Psilocybe cubensis TaxID=181762 RepID=A0A8H7Y1Z9_PSICU
MASIQTRNHSTLPPEIINLIFDHLANLDESPLEIQAALRSCCLVSKSFVYNARKRLWKQVTLSVDDTLPQRCNRFVRVLEQMNLDDKVSLIRNVQSLKLLFQEPIMGQRLSGQKERESVLRSIKRLFGKQPDIVDVFQMLENPNLTHFCLAAPEGTSFLWAHGVHSINPAILRILSYPNLKSFSLCNITSVSQEIVTAAFFSGSIQELAIRSTFVGLRRVIPPGIEITSSLADLKKLEMIDVSVPILFRIILDLLPSANVPRPFFPHLHTLIISVPSDVDDMSLLQEYVLAASASLETLEMDFHVRHRYTYSLPALEGLSFSGLVSLQCFKFQAASPDIIALLEECQRSFLNIFNICDFTNKLKTIELHFLLSAIYDYSSGTSLEKLEQAQHWHTIDRLFVSRSFYNLELFKITIEVRHARDNSNETHSISTQELQRFAANVLPRISVAIQIKLVIQGRVVFCENPKLLRNRFAPSQRTF